MLAKIGVEMQVVVIVILGIWLERPTWSALWHFFINGVQIVDLTEDEDGMCQAWCDNADLP